MSRALRAALVLAAACSSRSHAHAPAVEAGTPQPTASVAPVVDAGTPPLAAPDWIQTIAVGDHEAHVALPLGARKPLPLFVGVHGAGDRPDWSCSEWLAVTKGAAFVVCPHGTPDARWPGTRVWLSASQIVDESERAVRVAREKWGAYIAEGPAVYAAWSQGATLAAPVIALANRRDGGTVAYDRAILVEAGHTPIDGKAVARSLKASGVVRAIVSCSSASCRAFSKDVQREASAVGLDMHAVDVGDRGHWFDGPVFAALNAELGWFMR